MTLKEAKNEMKSFILSGKKITPELSDDWTYNIYTNYTNGDKLTVSSKKLNITITINLDLYYFFKEYIFTKKIIIDGNKLIGNMAFNKYSPVFEKDFLEAKLIIEDNELIEIIPNNELIEGSIYLDDLGDNYIYMGNMEYTLVSTNTFYSKPRKRYIYKYNKYIDYSKQPIIKTKKFKEFKKLMSLDEKNKFIKIIFEKAFMSSHIFLRKNGNTLYEILSDDTYFGSSELIKIGDKYGFYIPKNYINNVAPKLNVIDIEAYKLDIINQKINKLTNINNYIIETIEHFENYRLDLERDSVKFYLDYE